MFILLYASYSLVNERVTHYNLHVSSVILNLNISRVNSMT